jgi:hypothetical protein
MENLINILKKETETLKVQYITKTKEWARDQFDDIMVRSGWDNLQWCNFFGLTQEVYNEGRLSEYKSFPRGFYNSKQSREYSRLQDQVSKVKKMGIEGFVLAEEKKTELHYEGSIVKLANRIEKKGLNIDKLVVETSHIGVNINTTLTDGEKTVRAFTIIASGEIQRPHYRYLVK